jgi:hypothetical protein
MVKRRITLLIVLALMVSWTIQAQAFDDSRKGFMLGLGAGFGQAKWTIEASSGGASASASVDWTGFATDFKIGGGVSNNLMIYWSSRQVFFKEVPSNSQEESLFAQGIGGLGVSYFLNPYEPGFYINAVIGMGMLMDMEGSDSESGGGFAIGGGYEFSPHWGAEVTFMSATLEEVLGAEFKISNIMFTISWIGY